MLKTLSKDAGPVQLPLKISFLDSGVARVTIDELKRQQGAIELRHGSQARPERYNEASKWALVAGELPDKTVKAEIGEEQIIANYGLGGRYRAIIKYSPFSVDFLRDDEVQIQFNGRGLLNVEHWRPKVDKEKKEPEEPKEGTESKAVEDSTDEGEDESTWWEETFGGNTDSKPKGPESVGLDITFPGYQHVYGIPGHASSLSLKQTRY